MILMCKLKCKEVEGQTDIEGQIHKELSVKVYIQFYKACFTVLLAKLVVLVVINIHVSIFQLLIQFQHHGDPGFWPGQHRFTAGDSPYRRLGHLRAHLRAYLHNYALLDCVRESVYQEEMQRENMQTERMQKLKPHLWRYEAAVPPAEPPIIIIIIIILYHNQN